MKESELYQKAIDQWGEPLQKIMVIEECAELIKAISKWFRGQASDDDLIQEMVDVQLMINQLRVIINDESKWDRWWAYKVERLKERLSMKPPVEFTERRE